MFNRSPPPPQTEYTLQNNYGEVYCIGDGPKVLLGQTKNKKDKFNYYRFENSVVLYFPYQLNEIFMSKKLPHNIYSTDNKVSGLSI